MLTLGNAQCKDEHSNTRPVRAGLRERYYYDIVHSLTRCVGLDLLAPAGRNITLLLLITVTIPRVESPTHANIG